MEVLFRGLLSRLSLRHGQDSGELVAAADHAAGPIGGTAQRSPAASECNRRVSRLAVSDALWGEGFLEPGGTEEVLRLAKPLGLSAAHSLLLIGAASGGPARCLAESLGCWVSGFEADEDLAGIAARRCAVAGLGKRATITPWSPAEPRFAHRYFHRALALDPLASSRAEHMLPAMTTALKPEGEMVMTAILAGQETGSTGMREWLESEGRLHPPEAERDVRRLLDMLGHEVRVAKDITAAHLQMVLHQWHGFVAGLGKAKPHPAEARLIVREAETWLRRVRLMRAGAIRLVRFHSIGRGGS